MRALRRFLIVGLKEVDAGKTTVARALLLCLRERGITACGFKPKAGNTLWYDYEVVHEALSQGRLYGKDAKLLRMASGINIPEEIISPIHRLWVTPPHHLKQDLATLPYFIVDRVTLWSEKPKEMVVVNDALPFMHGARAHLGIRPRQIPLSPRPDRKPVAGGEDRERGKTAEAYKNPKGATLQVWRDHKGN